MTNEKMLERCLILAQGLNEDDRNTYDFAARTKTFTDLLGVGPMLAHLIHDLKDDLAAEEMKKAGRGSALTAAKRIIKRAKQINPAKEAYHGAWMENGMQCICTGCHAIRLRTPLDGLEDTNGKEHLDLGKTIAEALYATDSALPLPSVAELKAHIKTEKARLKAENKKANHITYDFGPDLPWVNAEYLLDLMEVLPGCTATIKSRGAKRNPLAFRSDAGDGILLPISPNHTEKK